MQGNQTVAGQAAPLDERLERKVIFRLARWLPLGLGAISAIALIIAVVALAYTMIPVAEPAKPIQPPVPSPVKLSRDQVASYQPAQQQDDSSPTPDTDGNQQADAAPAKTGLNPDAVKLAAELGRLGTTLESRGVAFTDHRERRCTYANPYTNECLNYETDVTQKGVGDSVLEVVSLYDVKSDEKPENVSSPDGWSFNVRIDSRLVDKIAVVAELNQILQSVPAAETRKFLGNWIQMRKEKEQAQIDQYQKKMDGQEAKYQADEEKYDAKMVTKGATRYSSLIAAGSALAILVFSGMVLAVIAIERHLRGMAAILEKISLERSA